MKTISLTQGKEAIVDDADFDWLNSVGSWHFDRYAKRVEDRSDKKTVVYMHRLIMNPRKGFTVDHINGNKLDNRRQNLRVCLTRNNTKNTSARGGYSKYCGVSYDKSRNKWVSTICVNYRKIHCRHDTELEAASHRDRLAWKHFGKYAKLNFPKQKER